MRFELVKHYVARIENFLDQLRRSVLPPARVPLNGRFFRSPEPVPFSDRRSGEYRGIKAGEHWGDAWDCAWFHITGTVPEKWCGEKLAARLDFNGEACVYDSSGCPLFGMSSGSVFSENSAKDIYYLPSAAVNNRRIELWVEAAANGLFGIKREKDPPRNCPERHGTYEGKVVAMELAVFDESVWKLMLDVEVLLSLFQSLEPGFSGDKPTNGMSPRARRLLFGLNKAIDVYADDRLNADAAAEELQGLLDSPANASDAVALSIGHAHIDTGWLWPVRETVRKCARTFASQIALLDKYPGYVFGASQPQHYLFVKKNFPELYEKIKNHVKKGGWELQGAMWVEADCNIISGESMARQLIHGKNFFKDEFDFEVRNLWIPDVFGYSTAMPQIMKKAGVDFLLTQKISWNQFNLFPHNTFRWKGIDGSEVIAHFPPEDNYNSPMLPESQMKAQKSFKESHLLEEFVCLFGTGNGGGGPKEEHVERAMRMGDLEGCPKVKFGRADEFFERLASRSGELEVWNGELYLELHRGTFTTQARTKKGNRLLERKLREVEFIYSALPADVYPARILDGLWKQLLLNQFHDILPGSSIRKVYEEAEENYAESLAECDRLINDAAARFVGNDDDVLSLVNSLSAPFRGMVGLPDAWAGAAVADEAGRSLPVHNGPEGSAVMVNIPPCSALTVRKQGVSPPAAICEGTVLENELMRYEFESGGELRSVFDKELGREILLPGEKGNVLSLYVDRPVNWDAWDIDITYKNELIETARGVNATPLGRSDIRQGIRFELEAGESRIEQNVCLNSHSKLLEFDTRVEWNERHRMLRVSFPVAVPGPEAACDIQFGFIRRPVHCNTGWDMAKFEVAAHKYVDISNSDFGVALLNDCKYGHNIQGGVLDLNLLRSPTHPDPDADQGIHSFRYALLPHRGELADSQVIEEAERFNFPPIVLPGVGEGRFKSPVAITGRGVTLAALKKAEKEDCHAIRLVENRGRCSSCRLTVPSGAHLIPCDLLEWQDEAPIRADVHELNFRPFEIKTFKIKYGDE